MGKETNKFKYLMQLPLSYIVAILMILIGQVAFEFIPLKVPDNDVVVTVVKYATFIAIWISAIAFVSICKWNRPIIKVLSTKPSGNNWKNFLLGILIGGGLNLICAVVAMLNKDIAVRFDRFSPLSLLAVFIFVFIQSSAEEFICRGYLYQKLIKTYKNPWVAIIGNSLLFGILHLTNPGVTAMSFINIMIVGIFFSMMVYYMDSLWCAMAAHAAWNFMQNIVLGLPNSGQVVPFSMFKLDAANARDSWAYNVGFGVEGTIVASVVLTIGCIVMFVWGRKNGKKGFDIWAK